MKLEINRIVFIIFIIGLVLPPLVRASDTMLVFVGEELEVLSIASGKEEAAWSAPAVANVITRQQLNDQGDDTLAKALGRVPGFYIEQNEKGSVPFLRGVPDSVLFLYDTIPIGSGVQKSSHAIDYEISMAPVKRIEVIRGSGSVLWGPDAFAGVVNVVPLTGNDFQGVETGFRAGSQDDEKSLYLNWGMKNKGWASFFSVSGTANSDDNSFNVVRFWSGREYPKPSEPTETRYGSGTPEDSKYIEFYGNLTLDDWFTLSARISQSQNNFAVSDWAGTYSWEEQLYSPKKMIKLELSKDLGINSGLRFTGYLSETKTDHTIVDTELRQKETSVSGEVIYDRSFFSSSGLGTLGVSWKQDRSEDIPIFKGFFPDYFDQENEDRLPNFHLEDYENRQQSVFGQYNQKLDAFEAWAGFRYDNNQEYENRVSYSLGASWAYSGFILKSIFGTAYRTPAFKQIDRYGNDKLEEIKGVNVQAAWKSDTMDVALTLFRNDISNHLVEDEYLGEGVSSPNSQTIDGVELELNWQPASWFRLSGNLTAMNNTGPDETYMTNYFYYEDLEGNITEGYLDHTDYPYDIGADLVGHIMLEFKPMPWLTLTPELAYTSRRTIYYPGEDYAEEDAGTPSFTYDSSWLLNFHLTVKNRLPFDIGIHLNNVFDVGNDVPGLYSVQQNNGFSAAVVVKTTW